MRFIDEVTIYVRGGDGGNGCVAFRREKYVPFGGPSGGDGGRGGDIILQADESIGTLLDLRYQQHYRADRGVHGQGHDRYGRNANPLLVLVPVGTLIFDNQTNELLADLKQHKAQFIAASGGQGGAGNKRFATPTNRAPRQATVGQPGQERTLRIELKLLAEVGLVGLPNVGKSTFISKVSAAKPKIADYPFTTLVPTLGVVSVDSEHSFVMADIPGIIQGAHNGAGLGHQFLRHIERTKVLVYLLDDRHNLGGEQGHPYEDLEILRTELKSYDPNLAKRPALVALNKRDLLPPNRKTQLEADFAAYSQKIWFVSAITGHGIPSLLQAISSHLNSKSTASCT